VDVVCGNVDTFPTWKYGTISLIALVIDLVFFFPSSLVCPIDFPHFGSSTSFAPTSKTIPPALAYAKARDW
jgi:hypothetical protein